MMARSQLHPPLLFTMCCGFTFHLTFTSQRAPTRTQRNNCAEPQSYRQQAAITTYQAYLSSVLMLHILYERTN